MKNQLNVLLQYLIRDKKIQICTPRIRNQMEQHSEPLVYFTIFLTQIANLVFNVIALKIKRTLHSIVTPSLYSIIIRIVTYFSNHNTRISPVCPHQFCTSIFKWTICFFLPLQLSCCRSRLPRAEVSILTSTLAQDAVFKNIFGL